MFSSSPTVTDEKYVIITIMNTAVMAMALNVTFAASYAKNTMHIRRHTTIIANAAAGPVSKAALRGTGTGV